MQIEKRQLTIIHLVMAAVSFLLGPRSSMPTFFLDLYLQWGVPKIAKFIFAAWLLKSSCVYM